MVCFEVYRNGNKICTAGTGEFGVLSAIISRVSFSTADLERQIAEGLPTETPVTMDFEVGGLRQSEQDCSEHLKWVENMPLSVGDELTVRIVDVISADAPIRRYLTDPKRDEERQQQYVRKMANQFGWTIEE